jgi:hypothetical protein
MVLRRAEPMRSQLTRSAVRRRHGLPVDAPLVVGWGADWWLDGADLFVRTLWELDRAGRPEVHAAWVGLDANDEAWHRILDEVVRCGLDDRVHLFDRSHDEVRLCADAAFLPFREGGDPLLVAEVLASGGGVVTFDVWEALRFRPDHMVVVEALRLDRAASAIISSLGAPRRPRWERTVEQCDVRSWVDEFLHLLEAE